VRRPGREDNRSYDAVIIGGGISGLVCGCRLASAGLNVLIVEQHFKPGGYCTSFRRRGFTFDAAAHSFGSYREGGIMRNILTELNLDSRLSIRRYDPTDTILFPGHRVSFWSDTNRTIQELQQAFPAEAEGIRSFYQFLLSTTPFELASLRNKTFSQLLDRYTGNQRLRSVLSFPILGVGALPPSRISAFSAVTLYTEFFVDGGYYPAGGMQTLADALAARFRELGGELRLSCLARKIRARSGKAEGVVLDNGETINARYVVSCCDARRTFLKLLGPGSVSSTFVAKLEAMTPSLSYFLAYLGVDLLLPELCSPGASFWVMPDHDIEAMYQNCLHRAAPDRRTPFLIHVPPDGKSIVALMLASYGSRAFWKNNKASVLKAFIRRIEAIFPGFSSHIVYQEAATPHTLERYTLNQKGAAYGWSSTPEQLFTRGLTQTTGIEHLYLAGHWTSQTQGISGAAYIGQETAKIILKKEKK
jgi:phytoene dehydrogenase-like protein